MTRRTAAYAGTALGLGALLWVAFVVGPEPTSAGPYPFALAAAGVSLGGLFPDRSAWVDGALLGAPAFLSAGWLAPRGDGDGLWLLWFPAIVVYSLWAVAASAVTRRLMRRSSQQKPHDPRA